MKERKRGSVSDPMDQFARAQAARLLGKLAFQVRHAAKHPNEEAIHDLRVSIRRLSQCLREFRGFFPRNHTRKILRRLGKVMDLAAEMRDRDVAIELIGGGGTLVESGITVSLRREREQAKQKLTRALGRWRHRDFSRKWRPWLAR